jgi:AcrR family transcriptional regulator
LTAVQPINRKEIEKEARKKDILDAAAKLFSESDFHEVKVDDIAERVGLSKGTIYIYFENKENLFYSIIMDRTQALLERLKKSLTCDLPFLDCLKCFISDYLQFFEEHKAFFKIAHSEKMRMSMEQHYAFHRYAKEAFTGILNVVHEIIQSGQKQAVLRKLDTTKSGRHLIGILNAFIYQRIILGSSSSLEEDMEFIMDVFLNGMKA